MFTYLFICLAICIYWKLWFHTNTSNFSLAPWVHHRFLPSHCWFPYLTVRNLVPIILDIFTHLVNPSLVTNFQMLSPPSALTNDSSLFLGFDTLVCYPKCGWSHPTELWFPKPYCCCHCTLHSCPYKQLGLLYCVLGHVPPSWEGHLRFSISHHGFRTDFFLGGGRKEEKEGNFKKY